MEKESMNDQQQDTQNQKSKAATEATSDASSNATEHATEHATENATESTTASPDSQVAGTNTPETAADSDNQAIADAGASNPDSAQPPRADKLTEPQPAPPPTKHKKTSAPKETKVSKLAILALLLALIALIIIGYGYTLIQTMHIQQSEQLSAVKEQLGTSDGNNRTLQQQNGQILGELNQVRSAVTEQKANVDELQNRLSRAMQQVSKLGTDTRKDWLLAEVEYLLRLANQRVLMERNAGGALSLLQGADRILKETDDVSIYPVRKALALDIVALEAIPSVDIEGMYLKLSAINSQVDNLRLLPITDKHQLPEMLQQITPDTLSQVNASWASAMDKLGSLVVIRHRDEPVTPLLSPEQHYFLTQNLHLMLEQTQQALLQGKQDAYSAGVKKAGQWIDTYFEAADPTTQALLRNLSDLEGIKIAPALPDISGSLRELKTYLVELHNLQGAAR